ncbi:tyrosine-type recombinase/integrase [Parabacteroides sp. FAFU027]|uniref:tyrosine-type recombinase/integrase n=1 Tax=Parabacteroides sp. FAFU027 TaxID=2922715 RepID=UPI001FAFC748|nr:tyrosine-type recombinase/integrase [Parabacteroides sp. FAFU027]
MSRKYSHTTADVLQWSDAINLIAKLEKDENYKMSLFISVSIFFGLRVSDTLSITWEQILNKDQTIKVDFEVIEKKTKKYRIIKINPELAKHILSCYQKMRPKSLQEFVFVSNKRSVYSVQRINIILKEIREKYKIEIKNFSCHSLRKCFGAELYRRGDKSEHMLLKLSMIFNHSSTQITRRYIGIQSADISNMYDVLTF